MKQFSISTLLLCLAFSVWGQQSKPAFNAELLKPVGIRNIGPGAMSGRITAITVDPFRPEVIYAGAASGGVWRSTSGGTDWQPIFDKAPTLSVGSIAISPGRCFEDCR